MAGNDLTVLRGIIPSASTQRAQARADITTILDGILSDIEPKVTPSGLDISSALSFLSGGVYSPASNVGYANFQDRATGTAVANESVYVKGDELYYKDGSGNEVQLTSGGTATAGSSGDIGTSGSPAYAAGTVHINWNGTTAEYSFLGASSAFATLFAKDLKLDDPGSANTATLKPSSGMATSLSYSLPLAFPASTSVMTLTSAGVMASTRDVSVDDVTVSGSYKHGAKVRTANLGPGYSTNVNVSLRADIGSLYFYWRLLSSTPAGQGVIIPLDLRVGETLDSVAVTATNHATETLDYEIFRQPNTSSNYESSGVSVATATSATGASLASTVVTATHTVLDGNTYYISISPTIGGTAQLDVGQVRINYSVS